MGAFWSRLSRRSRADGCRAHGAAATSRSPCRTGRPLTLRAPKSQVREMVVVALSASKETRDVAEQAKQARHLDAVIHNAVWARKAAELQRRRLTQVFAVNSLAPISYALSTSRRLVYVARMHHGPTQASTICMETAFLERLESLRRIQAARRDLALRLAANGRMCFECVEARLGADKDGRSGCAQTTWTQRRGHKSARHQRMPP